MLLLLGVTLASACMGNLVFGVSEPNFATFSGSMGQTWTMALTWDRPGFSMVTFSAGRSLFFSQVIHT